MLYTGSQVPSPLLDQKGERVEKRNMKALPVECLGLHGMMIRSRPFSNDSRRPPRRVKSTVIEPKLLFTLYRSFPPWQARITLT